MRAVRVGVDLELAARLRAIGIVSLAIDAAGRSVLAIGPPSNHETAAFQHGNRGGRLIAGGVGIDLELPARFGAIGIVSLAPCIAPRSARAIGIPGYDEAAVGQSCHLGIQKPRVHIRIDLEFASLRDACGVVSLAEDAAFRSVVVQGQPDSDKSSVGQRRQRGIQMGIRSGSVEPELAAGRAAKAVVHLAIGIPAGSQRIPRRFPSNYKAAARQHGDRRHALLVQRACVDRNFRAYPSTEAHPYA